MFDIVTIPLRVFDLGDAPIFTVMQWTSLLYWSADIPRQFLMGFEEYGTIETRLNRIAKNYATSWLVPDLFILVLIGLLPYFLGIPGRLALGGPQK